MPRRGLGPLVVVAAAWVLVYLPPLVQARFLPARDLAATHIPWRTVWAHQLRAGHLPIWDPLSNQGRPLLANPNAMAAYPGTLLFLLAAPETAELLHIALHHLLLLAGLYLLARRSGAPGPAAAVAAAAVGTCGVVWSATTFLNVLASLAWTPWALAMTVATPGETAGARRRACRAGAAVGLSFLAGEPVVAALAAALCAVVVCRHWPPALRRFGLLGAGTALAVASPVLVPLLALYGEAARGALGAAPGSLAADALAPRRFLELLFPSVFGPPLADAEGGFWAAPSFPWQRYYPTIFLGPGTVLLTLAAWRERGRQRTWWVLAGLVGIFAMVLGHPAAAALTARLPVAGHVRFAVKLLVPLMLALTPPVAAGFARLATMPRRSRRRLALLCLLPALVAALAAGPGQGPWRTLLSVSFPASAARLAEVPRAELAAALLGDSASLALPAAALLAAGPQAALLAGATFAAGVLSGRGVLRFEPAVRWANPPSVLGRAAGAPTVVCSLAVPPRSQVSGVHPELQRFWAARTALVPGYGTRWGVGYVLARGPDGLEPLRQELLAAVAAGLDPGQRGALARALGASLVVADAPLPGWDGDLVDGLWAGRASPAAEAYLARRLLPADGLPAAVQAMAAASFSACEDAVVEGSGGASLRAGGSVLSAVGPPHRRTYRVRAEGPGLLVIRQSYLAAWRARVDGQTAAVAAVNGAQLGVPVPAGDHTVELFLNPVPYRLGALGPLLLVAVMCLRAAAGRRGRQSASGARGRSSRANPPVP